MKRPLKRISQHVAAALAPLRWRMQSAPRLLVLMYHRVLPPGHPDRQSEQPGMYVSPDTLSMHLAVLRRHGFALVQLDDWLEKTANAHPVPRLACAITFDDGWRDNYEYACPVLAAAAAPATIYLVSDLVGTQYSFWPNTLARILSKGEAAAFSKLPGWLQALIPGQAGARLDAAQIDEVIVSCKALRTEADMLSIVNEIAGEPGAHSTRDLMSWDEIRELRAGGLVSFGSHTRRHTRVSGIKSPEALRDEIVGSRDAIERQLGAAPQTFCYPNGDISPDAVELVSSVYKGAVTTRRGWHRREDDPFLIRRVGVHEDISRDRAAFLARIGGWPGI